jgi:uncharacterized damage-inducible protein DinB
MMLEHLRRMARYNRWANRRLYAACERLSVEAYHRSRLAFFGSIHGPLNHVLVADRIWFARMERLPPPHRRLDEQLYPALGTLKEAREAEDERIVVMAGALDGARVQGVLRYQTASRREVETPLHLCWLHVFNHQTHHRGQVHDQLSHAEVSPPPLDLIYYLRESLDH